MPENVRVNEEIGIIEVISYGDLSREDLEETKNHIQKLRGTHGINKVLIETTKLTSAPSTLDILETIQNYPRDFKIAMLMPKSSPLTDEIDFAETVGVNVGLRVAIFHTLEDAYSWLGVPD